MPNTLATIILCNTWLHDDTFCTSSLVHEITMPLIRNFIASGNGILGKLYQNFWVQKHSNHYLFITYVYVYNFSVYNKMPVFFVCSPEKTRPPSPQKYLSDTEVEINQGDSSLEEGLSWTWGKLPKVQLLQNGLHNWCIVSKAATQTYFLHRIRPQCLAGLQPLQSTLSKVDTLGTKVTVRFREVSALERVHVNWYVNL